jgi:hypothetical protein
MKFFVFIYINTQQPKGQLWSKHEQRDRQKYMHTYLKQNKAACFICTITIQLVHSRQQLSYIHALILSKSNILITELLKHI